MEIDIIKPETTVVISMTETEALCLRSILIENCNNLSEKKIDMLNKLWGLLNAVCLHRAAEAHNES